MHDVVDLEPHRPARGRPSINRGGDLGDPVQRVVELHALAVGVPTESAFEKTAAWLPTPRPARSARD
jgi:hypothetical protein